MESENPLDVAIESNDGDIHIIFSKSIMWFTLDLDMAEKFAHLILAQVETTRKEAT